MATTVPMRRLLTISELAAHLNVSVRTVRRLVSNREIPAVRVGAQLRIDESAVEAWLAERRV